MFPALLDRPARFGWSVLADPGLIGLLGFVFPTVTAQLVNLGIQEQSSAFWIGAAFRGIVQIVAGLLSFRIGDKAAFCASRVADSGA